MPQETRATDPDRYEPGDIARLWPSACRPLAPAEAAHAAAQLRAGESAGGPQLAPAEASRIRELAVLIAAYLDAHLPLGSALRVVGLNGAQGSGKTTLARELELALERRGTRAATLSLDDLYLTRSERGRLARRVHPLFTTRGVPGTHDLSLGRRTLEGLARLAPGETLTLPRFDKRSDDRAPGAQWPTVTGPVRTVLLEGWCVGATPLPAEALSEPINALEREADPHGHWRRHMNARLEGDYAAFFARMDALIMLRVPDLDAVRRWRGQQENEVHAQGGRGMDAAALEQFIEHYERLTRHMLADLPDRADVVISLDDAHGVAAIRARA